MKTYALITGASQGFGKSLALECANRRIDLVLIALPDSGLKELSLFIKINFNVDVIYFEYDLSQKENCISIYKALQKKNIKINYMINNAGMLSQGEFINLSSTYFLNQINVNVMTPTLLIKLFLEDLKEANPSGILNVGSLASFFSLPKKQVYGGTKAYLMSFSNSLRMEIRKFDITVSVVCPGGMNTTPNLCLQNRQLNVVTRASILNPEDAAQYTIDRFLKGKTLIIPGRLNRFFLLLNSLLPNRLKEFITSRATKEMRT